MKTQKLTMIGLFTAILCILGPMAVVMPFSPVPVSLSTLGVLLACLILGPRNGLFCTVLYLLLGFAGLPIFSGFTGGVGKLLGPSGGYLIGYLFLAVIGGKLAKLWKKQLFLQGIGLFTGMLFCYLFGTVWLSCQAGMDFQSALWIGVIPYLPFDIGKIAAALVLYKTVRERV